MFARRKNKKRARKPPTANATALPGSQGTPIFTSHDNNTEAIIIKRNSI